MQLQAQSPRREHQKGHSSETVSGDNRVKRRRKGRLVHIRIVMIRGTLAIWPALATNAQRCKERNGISWQNLMSLPLLAAMQRLEVAQSQRES